MANADTPMGLRPVRYVGGAPYNGAARLYSTATGDGTAFGIGDLVKITGAGQMINGNVYQDVAKAASGDVFTGVCVGCFPDTRDSTLYRAGATQRLVWVADDPNLLFMAQEGSSGTAFTANDIGLNCNVSVAAVNTTTGISASLLDNASEANTNTLDLKIVDFVNRPDNEIGYSAKWLVRINRHRFVDQLAGV